MVKTRVLVVEDDDLITELIVKALTREGYEVDSEVDGEKGYRRASDGNYDVLILDIMLPNKDGLEICQQLRDENVKSAILILSAQASEEYKVKGLDIGADDYLTKPFGYRELNARVSALLRRPHSLDLPELSVGKLRLDNNTKIVTINDQAVELRNKEFELLKYLMLHRNQIISHKELLKEIWDVTPKSSSNRLEACMKNLRKSLGENPTFQIETRRNMGYRITEVQKNKE